MSDASSASTAEAAIIKAVNDILYHDEFVRYTRLEVLKRSKLAEAAVVQTDQTIAKVVAAAGFGGTTIDMPYWNDIPGSTEDEVQKNGEEIGLNYITAGQDVATVIRRAGGFVAADFEAILAGDDPMAVIKDRVALWQRVRRDVALAAVLEGVFAASSMSGLILDVTGANGTAAQQVSLKNVMDCAQLFGDEKGKLTTLYMHSATATYLKQKYGTSALMPGADTPNKLERFNNYRVVEDDNVPLNPATGVTAVYMFAPGAICEDNVPQLNPYEAARDAGKSINKLYVRDSYVQHVRGVKWKGTAAGTWPTNAELKTGTNWERVYPANVLRACKLVAKIDADPGASSASSGSSASSASSASAG